MKVSVIILVWNRAENTKKLLDELVRQKQEFPQTEIIAVENGSTEDMSFLSRYGDSIVLRHNEVAGIYRAANTAFSLVTGDYVCVVDNDDWIPEYYLRVIYENIETRKDWYVWKWYSDQTPVTMEGLDLKHPLKLNWAMWGYCIKADLYKGIVFNEDMYVGDDIRVMFQIITEDTDGAFIPEFMYFYKWYGNEESASHIWNREHEPMHP